MNNNLFNNELSDELKDVTLCFVRDDIGEYLNVKLSDLVEWEQDKLDNYFNYDPALCDILHVDDDLNNIINADHYCPCYGGLFSDLDAINEYLLNGVGDLELLSAVCDCCSNLEEAIQTINDGDFSVYSDCNNDYDLGYYIIDEFYSDLTEKCGVIANYIDYEALGRDHRLESNGTFSNIGWVEVY